MYKVELYASGKKLAEDYQTVDIGFAFADVLRQGKDVIVKQLHDFVRCRELLGNVLCAVHYKIPFEIYGFSFDGSTKKIPMKQCAMLIKYSDKKILLSHVRVLNHFEDKARWRKTTLIDINTKDSKEIPVMLALSSKQWLKAPSLISMYSLLWRLSGWNIKDNEDIDTFLERVKSLHTQDSRYLHRLEVAQTTLGFTKNMFYTIMKHNRTLFSKGYIDKREMPIDKLCFMHHHNGILALVEQAALLKSCIVTTKTFQNEWAKNLIALSNKETKKEVMCP